MATDEWETKPKSLEAIQDIIYNESKIAAPPELAKYIYRKTFHLSAQEMEDEPIDQFFTNLQILGYMKDKERLESKHG